MYIYIINEINTTFQEYYNEYKEMDVFSGRDKQQPYTYDDKKGYTVERNRKVGVFSMR